MSSTHAAASPVVVVTGANGFVGSRVCALLSGCGARVRAVVRRAGTAPTLPGVEEWVGDFLDPALASSVVRGATSVVTTVHPMGSDRATQEQIAVEGTPVLARAARDARVDRLVHVSTAAVYDRSAGAGDIDEISTLVPDDAGDYAVTKRDTDAALSQVEGITRVLVRPPAILGAGETSVWNTLRPASIRDEESERRAKPEQTWPWVHVDDLAAFLVDLATGSVADATDPQQGPVKDACTAVNVSGEPARVRDYYETVTGALGVDPVWDDSDAWTGAFLVERARAWGWTPHVDLAHGLEEIARGLRS